MMAIDRSPNSFDLALALEGRPRRWSPIVLVGIGLSAALHLALLWAVLQMQFAGHRAETIIDPPPIVITRWTPPKPAPHVKTPPPSPIHKTPPTVQPTRTTPFVPPPTDTKATESARPLTTETPSTQTAAAETPPAPPKVITDPTWISRPSAEEMARFYPPAALDGDVGGLAVLNCTVNAGGRPMACVVVSETPKGQGFGAAAVKLSSFFKMKPRTENGQDVDGGTIQIPIRFNTGD
jgi:protein TonB